MRRQIRFLCLVVIVLFGSAKENFASQEIVWPFWEPKVEFAGKFGTHRNLQRTTLFYPFYQREDNLCFLDLRFSNSDSSTIEGNIGGGCRLLFPSDEGLIGDVILGGYGFGDRKRSPNYNYFTQATFGAELLMENFDLRANLYKPKR